MTVTASDLLGLVNESKLSPRKMAQEVLSAEQFLDKSDISRKEAEEFLKKLSKNASPKDVSSAIAILKKSGFVKQ